MAHSFSFLDWSDSSAESDFLAKADRLKLLFEKESDSEMSQFRIDVSRRTAKRKGEHDSGLGCVVQIGGNLILLALITGNSSLEPLLDCLFAQNLTDLSWRGFGRNRTGDLRITQMC